MPPFIDLRLAHGLADQGAGEGGDHVREDLAHVAPRVEREAIVRLVSATQGCVTPAVSRAFAPSVRR